VPSRTLDWNGLHFVLSLARHGSLERAAEELRVDPSTVSRKVRALERSVGALLFDRTAAGHRPTAVGTRFLEAAEQVAASISAMERLADRADDRLEGTIRIAAGEAIAVLLAPLLARFRRRHPAVRFEVHREAGPARLLRHDADVALGFERPEQIQLASRRIGVLGFGLYASREYLEAHPFHPEAPTVGHELLGWAEGLPGLPGARWLEERAAGAAFALRADRLDALLAAAGCGLGLAVLPCDLADADPRLLRLLGPERVVTRELWLVLHRDRRQLARLRAFADLVAADLLAGSPRLDGALRAAG
jgi:DNA-binding transcriptional LysR family regulator